ncbi:MAG: type VII secretion protein EccE [Mycobacterium sp.]
MRAFRGPAPIFLVTAAILALVLIGGAVGGYAGAAVGLVLGLLLGVLPWRGHPMWVWAGLYLRRKRTVAPAEPVTVASDRAGGGVRYQDGTAVVAVQVVGKIHTPTVFTGSASTHVENTIDVQTLYGLLHQSLDLTIDSMSVVIAGARRRSTGDYARVYDTIIGPPPYAGQRETWIIARIKDFDNGDALNRRPSAGSTAVAAAQRITAALRMSGVRARVATSTDIVEFERRLGSSALEADRQLWGSIRGEQGFLTTYAYRTRDTTSEVLGQVWTMPADGVIQNITVFGDRTASATVTIRTPQPLPAPPSTVLRPLPGEQAAAMANNLCVPLQPLHGLERGSAPDVLTMPVGPSGVLLGKVGAGDRLMLPLVDPGEFTRVHIAADDHLAKRIIIRTAASGERITVHSKDIHRWLSVRPADIALTDRPRPAPGTTVSVLDGALSPAPRPQTLITLGPPGQSPRGHVDILIAQTGPAEVDVTVGGRTFQVEVELFRAENRYVAAESISMMSGSEFADESR